MWCSSITHENYSYSFSVCHTILILTLLGCLLAEECPADIGEETPVQLGIQTRLHLHLQHKQQNLIKPLPEAHGAGPAGGPDLGIGAWLMQGRWCMSRAPAGQADGT
jgi:hypothetical protein